MGAVGAVKLPNGARVVDAKGKYLIPGLWDMHHHPWIGFSDLLLLANGVTGFRDAWTPIPLDTMFRRRREILAGKQVGPPRQILAGRAIDAKASCDRASEPVTEHVCVELGDTADALQVVKSFKDAGAEFLKIYTPSWEVYAAARRLGMPFGGHATGSNAGPTTAIQVSDSGSRILDHSFALGKPCSPSGSVEECAKWRRRFGATTHGGSPPASAASCVEETVPRPSALVTMS
jgi:hypothetical protein